MKRNATVDAAWSRKTNGSLGVRRARPEDIPKIRHLIERSVRELQRADYDESELESALQSGLLDVDPGLVSDGTYFVAQIEGRIVGSGGWSFRRSAVNGEEGSNDELDPRAEAAKIRAFYVLPERARLGIGARLLRESEEAARRAGFRRMELVSTLTGAPFYASRGWRSHESLEIDLPDGRTYPAIRMTKTLGKEGATEDSPSKTAPEGLTAVVRMTEPEDSEKLRAMYLRLSGSSIYRRFHTPYPSVPERMVSRLSETGRPGEGSFVALAEGGIVGHALYVAESPREAEFAIVVEDSWQSKGVGKALLFRLALEARRRGLETFTAMVLVENRRMIGLLESVFAKVERLAKGGSYFVRASLSDIEPASNLEVLDAPDAARTEEARPDSFVSRPWNERAAS